MHFRRNLATSHLEAVTATIAQSQRPTTRKAYTSAWNRFQVWARQEGVKSLPAEPVTVAAYLVHRDALGLSFSSLEMDRKAVNFFHQSAGFPSPTASVSVKMTMAGVRKRAAERGRAEPRQAPGLRETGLRAIVETAHKRRVYPSGRTESRKAARIRGSVDIAIASVMRDAMLRRHEAANLRWGEVEFRPDGSSRVTIRRSKTSDQSTVLYVGLRASGIGKHTPLRPGSRGRGLRRSVRPDHQSPDRRHVQASGTRQGLHRTFPQGRHDPGSCCTRGRPCCDHERRTVEVQPHASPLLAGRSGRPGGHRPLLRRTAGRGISPARRYFSRRAGMR